MSNFSSNNTNNTFITTIVDIRAPDVIFTTNDVIIHVSMFISIVASFINLIVFAHKNLRQNHFTYNFLLCMSVADFTYSTSLIIWRYFWRYCQPSPLMCGSSVQYFSQVLSIGIETYFTSCLAIFSIFLEIFLNAQRYFLISNKKYLRDVTAIKAVPIIAVISLIYYLPLLFSRVILSDVSTFVPSLNATIIFIFK